MSPQSRHPLRWLQERVASAFEITSDDRSTRVATLLARSGKGSAAFWLQLVLAMTIATLGLILDSTAVVIGAMLVSPLMSPIVELGMGLAVGSPVLVLRSFVRVVKSVVLVVGGAALITQILPFHETTTELAARTSPTALDLLVAVCCAIAAAYAQVRPASETASTAAGTAIGIALVPPLCVVGYGLGTRSAEIAKGSALLFTANFCAIVLFAVVCFLLLGFDRADIRSLEDEELAKGGQSLATRVGRALARLFASRYGWPLRLLMPIALVAAVYLPLRRALDEVSWEVRVRREAERILSSDPRAVQVSLTVKHHAVSLRLLAIGNPSEVQALKKHLEARLSSVAKVTPKVEIIAVPDAAALRAAAEREVVAAPTAPEPALPRTRRIVRETLGTAWPTNAAGTLARWSLEIANDSIRVEVVHIGAPLGDAGEALLASTLSIRLESTVTIHDVALSPTPIVAETQGAFVAATAEQIAIAASVEGVNACVVAPRAAEADASVDASETGDDADGGSSGDLLRSPLFALTAAKGRLAIREGKRFELALSLQPCPDAPAGAAMDASSDAPSGETD